MRFIACLGVLSAAALVLGACRSENRRSELVTAPTATRGVEGRWHSVGGTVAYNANFNGGRYTATEAGTGAVLAEGSYINLGVGQVSIDYTSKLRKQRFAVNCNQVEANRLACATSDGSRYEFTRS